MAVHILNTNQARTKWRDIVDSTHAGRGDVIVERYGKRMVAVIPYEDYEALQEELEDLRLGRIAQAELEAWRKDPSAARPWEEVKADLEAEGWLSD
jgi:prevent-host-death family protein